MGLKIHRQDIENAVVDFFSADSDLSGACKKIERCVIDPVNTFELTRDDLTYLGVVVTDDGEDEQITIGEAVFKIFVRCVIAAVGADQFAVQEEVNGILSHLKWLTGRAKLLGLGQVTTSSGRISDVFLGTGRLMDPLMSDSEESREFMIYGEFIFPVEYRLIIDA